MNSRFGSCIILIWIFISIFMTSSKCDTDINTNEISNNTIMKYEEDLKIKLHLYTRSRGMMGYQLNYTNINKEDIQREGFELNSTLVIIIHGFLGSVDDANVIGQLKKGYLNRTSDNILMLDWSYIAKDKYTNAVANVTKVIEYSSIFINRLINIDLVNNLHIVGYSMGAQIAGRMKFYLSRKINRITALDPAKVLFDQLSDNEKLTTDDADFVMVIHTSGNILSYDQSIGHADFYPNEGVAPQPGCELNIFTALFCSHRKAPSYFTDSLYFENSMMAISCSTWKDFTSHNNCSNERVPMGYNTPDWIRGNFYLTTKPTSPFGYDYIPTKSIITPSLTEMSANSSSNSISGTTRRTMNNNNSAILGTRRKTTNSCSTNVFTIFYNAKNQISLFIFYIVLYTMM